MKKILSIIMCGLILSSAAISLAGCETAKDIGDDTVSTATSDTPSTQTSQSPALTDELSSDVRAKINDFSTILFKQMYSSKESGENTLVSPISVFTALSLLSNGANDKTAEQINDVLSGYYYNCTGDVVYDDYDPLNTAELNAYFNNYIANLESKNYDDVVTKLSMANSVWAFEKDNLTFNDNFFDVSENYYNAQLFSEKISNSTVKKINNWVSDNTDGMIEEIIDELSSDSVACLINALAFEGEWENTYTSNEVYTDKFTDYFGNQTDAEFMSSTEAYYIDDGNATGFIKDYKGNGNIQYENEYADGGSVEYEEPRYCFVALLPNEGTDIDEYINTMAHDTITNAVNSAKPATVFAKLPKFEFDDSINFNEILYDLGMPNAFDPNTADFSNLANTDGNIHVTDVLHNTHISVTEEGTKAAASTAVIMQENAVAAVDGEYYEVTLDRPFVFAIYDYEEEMPVFIGVLMTV